LKRKQTTSVYIGLGSNLAEPIEQIESARVAIGNIDGVEEIALSGLYSSPPMGPPDQPDYINAVMAVKTGLAPHVLLKGLQCIETAQGRVRVGERWGPRTLDLDILLYGEEMIITSDLIVPHVGIAERAFVLYPLAEIAPGIEVPGRGSLSFLLSQCPKDGLRRLK